MFPIRTKTILLLALFSGVLLFGSIRPTPIRASTIDVNAPVGIYEVSVLVPRTVSYGQAFNITVNATVAGFNQSALWYNTTLYEGIESIDISLVEAGTHREKIISTTMITNTNASVTPPLMPVYIINVTSVEHVFTFNSSFLDPGAHSWVVTIKGFRWALLGLAIGYSNFYIQNEGTIFITGESVLARYEELLAKYDSLRADYDDLNSTYSSLLAEFDNLSNDYDELQTNYSTLQHSYNSIEMTYNSLNSTYNSLKADYDDLKSKHEVSTSELSTARNLSYLSAAITIIFIATAGYFIFRKLKVKA